MILSFRANEASSRFDCRCYRKQEKILIYGDYDADGVAATSILSGILGAMLCLIFSTKTHRTWIWIDGLHY